MIPPQRQLEIGDTGPGFRDVEPKEIFDKFSRSQTPGNSGSGLGLSIVKGFTEALGGSVQLKNKPGKAAVFSIFIPVKMHDFTIAEI